VTCKKVLNNQKDFRFLVIYLSERGGSVRTPRDIPRDVVRDQNVLEGYLQVLEQEGYVELHTAARSGRREIDRIRVNRTIRVLAEEAKQYDQDQNAIE
jgi:hypothetical protein